MVRQVVSPANSSVRTDVAIARAGRTWRALSRRPRPACSHRAHRARWLAAMNSRLRQRPPKHRLAQRSGSAIWPIGSPAGLNTRTPSSSALAHAPAAPQIAIDIDAEPVRRPPGPASMNIRLLRQLRAVRTTSNTRSSRGSARRATRPRTASIRRARTPARSGPGVIGDHGDRAGLAVDAIDVGGSSGSCFSPS